MKTTNIKRSNADETTSAVIDMLAVSGTIQNRDSQTHTNTFIGDTHMERKNLFSKMGATLILVSLMMVGLSSQVYAIGTLAGTPITSSAQATYKNQSNTGLYTSNLATLTITVAHKVVINFDNQNPTQTRGDGITIYQAFTVTNDGNSDDVFKFFRQSTPGGWNVAMYHDVSGFGTFESSTDTPIANNDLTPSLNPGDSYRVILVINIPRGSQATDNTLYSPVIRVTSTKPQGTLGNGLPHIVNPDLYQDVTLTVTISKPIISVTVFNAGTLASTTDQIPGTTVSYQVRISNAGTAALPGNDTLKFKWNATYTKSPTSGGGTDDLGIGTDLEAGYYKWEVGTVAAGGYVDKTITVTIDQTTNNGAGVAATQPVDIAAGEILFNHQFDGGAFTTANNSTYSFSVDRADGVTLTVFNTVPYLQNQGVNANESGTYFFLVKNIGNATSTFALTRPITVTVGTITGSTVFTYSASAAYNADPAAATYTEISQSNADDNAFAIGNLSSIPAGGERWIKVVVAVPSGTTGDADRTFSFTADPNTFNQAVHGDSPRTKTITGYRLNVVAPNIFIDIAKSIAGQPNNGNGNFTGSTDYMPGTTVLYTVTITNSGDGDAKNVESQNTIAHLTTTELVELAGVNLDPAGNGFGESGNNGKIALGSAVETVDAIDRTMTVETFDVATGIVKVKLDLLPAGGKIAAYQYQAVIK